MRRKIRKNTDKVNRFRIIAPALLTASLLFTPAGNANKEVIPKDLKSQIIVFESKPKAGPTKIIMFNDDGLVKVHKINLLRTKCSTESWHADKNPERTKEIVEEVQDGLEVKVFGKIRGNELKEKTAAKLEDIPKEYAEYIAGTAQKLCEKNEIGTVSVSDDDIESSKLSAEIYKPERTGEKILYGITVALVLLTIAVSVVLFRVLPPKKDKKPGKRDIKPGDEGYMNWTNSVD